MRRVLVAASLALLALVAAQSDAAYKTKNAASPNSGYYENHRLTSPLPGGYGSLYSPNYAGTIAMSQSRRAFYWLVLSESYPETDPVMLWLNGGPGCSSLLGMLTENGPVLMRHDGWWHNEFRWTRNVSFLYLESPAGVGFSLDPQNTNWTDSLTADYNYEFLVRFFNTYYPALAVKQSFYIGGESYAGHYVPQLAQKILYGSDAGLLRRMKGFMVGNPCTGDIGCMSDDPTLKPYLQGQGFLPYMEPLQEGPAYYDPYDLLVPTCVADEVYSRMRFFAKAHPVLRAYGMKKAKLAAAKAKLVAAPRRQGAAAEVRTAAEVLRNAVLEQPPAAYGPCAQDHITAWLNLPEVRAALHVNDAAEDKNVWAACSNTVQYFPPVGGVVKLYENFFNATTWDIMIFSGLSDSIVNMMQTQWIIKEEMKRPLASKVYTAWTYPYVWNATETQLGGWYLQYDRFAWAGVRDAGHMVAQYNPPPALELFRSFITTGKPGRR